MTAEQQQQQLTDKDNVLRFIFTFLDRDQFTGYLDKSEMSILFEGLHSYEPCIPRFIHFCFEENKFTEGIDVNGWLNCFKS